MSESEDLDLLVKLAKAKNNVRWLLDHSTGLVDNHNLTYWAGVVERLRAKAQEAL